MKNNHYKHILRSLFCQERKKFCSTFTINRESSLVYSVNIFNCLQTNIYVFWYLVSAVFKGNVLKSIVFVLNVHIQRQNKVFFQLSKRCIFLTKIFANAALRKSVGIFSWTYTCKRIMDIIPPWRQISEHVTLLDWNGSSKCDCIFRIVM